MSYTSPAVPINPAVLKWALESSGWTLSEISAKLKVPSATVGGWESGKLPLKLRALEALARYVKRPLAAFLLPEPPREAPPPTDFRVLPGKQHTLARETLLALRRARRLQSIARDLMDNLGRDVRPLIGQPAPTDNPEATAIVERQRFGVSIGDQLGWRSPYEAFRVWREALEKTNILVFQLPMPVADARGFSLTGREPFAIVVNSSDSIHARIFTLFHEYAHLLLRGEGICNPNGAWLQSDKLGQPEGWCNQFAASFLVQRVGLPTASELHASTRDAAAFSNLLATQSQRFKVSKEVILRRLLTLGIIRQARFQQELTKLKPARPPVKRSPGYGLSPANKCLTERGPWFISLVLEGQARSLITYGDLADYLGLKLTHVPKVQAKLGF